MFFNMKEMNYIWTSMLDWTDISDAQFCHTYQPKKGTVETYTFFVKDGLRLRLDYEIDLENCPPVGEPWPTEALDEILKEMRSMIDEYNARTPV